MTALLVVGAHLDDAVLTCGRLLAATPGAVVCTVFAGRPDTALGHTAAGTTEWDTWCGFGPGDDVVGARLDEDDAALAALGARAVRFGFVDAQYAPRPATADVVDALGDVVRSLRPQRVVVPLGLLHRDHRSVADAWVRIVLRDGAPTGWAVAEDAPYRDFVPVRHRWAALRRQGLRLGPPAVVTDDAVGRAAVVRARTAVAAYVSQQAGLRRLEARAAGTPDAAPRVAAGDVLRPLLATGP